MLFKIFLDFYTSVVRIGKLKIIFYMYMYKKMYLIMFSRYIL